MMRRWIWALAPLFLAACTIQVPVPAGQDLGGLTPSPIPKITPTPVPTPVPTPTPSPSPIPSIAAPYWLQGSWASANGVGFIITAADITEVSSESGGGTATDFNQAFGPPTSVSSTAATYNVFYHGANGTVYDWHFSQVGSSMSFMLFRTLNGVTSSFGPISMFR